MLAHVSFNRCKDRSGLVSSTSLSKGRVDAALEMERLAAESVVQFATEHGSVDDSVTNESGGVGVTQSLLDKDDEAMKGAMFGDSSSIFDNSISVDGSVKDASDASVDGIDNEAQPKNDWLSFSERRRDIDHQPAWDNTIERMNELGVADSQKPLTTPDWTKTLFPNAKATPVPSGWTQPKIQPSVRRGGRGAFNHTARVSIINGQPVRTDWDHFVFDRDAMDRLRCPFQQCG